MTSNSALTIGTILNGNGIKYKIVDVLGQGGFGITYMAVGEVMVGNVPAEVKFAIKEHFPAEACKRNGSAVEVNEDKRPTYQSSLADFISEAKKLHTLGSQNENIVKVNEVFEENGTAYYVMQYINGDSLTGYIKSKGKLTYSEALDVMSPIFDAVNFLHSARINHLDIKPENIMLHRGVDGISPILIDFGLSVHFKKNGDKTSPKGVEGVSEGYSPLEQYAGINGFSPATDVYALAATMLFTLTAKQPKSAAEIRLADVRNSLEGIVPQNVVDAICRAMNKSDEDRTPSVKALKSDLGLITDGGSTTKIVGIAHPSKRSNTKAIIVAGVIVTVVAIATLVFMTRDGNIPEPTPEPMSESVPLIADTVKVEPVAEAPDTAEVPNVAPVQTPGPEKATPATQHTGIQEAKPAATTTNGTLSMGYATWNGDIRNGKPDGKGTLTFHSTYRVDRSSSEEANPGDYFIATYDNGSLIIGKLYDSNGNLKCTIIP